MFVYEVSVYLVLSDRVELLSMKRFVLKKEYKFKSFQYKKINKKLKVLKYIDLINFNSGEIEGPERRGDLRKSKKKGKVSDTKKGRGSYRKATKS